MQCSRSWGGDGGKRKSLIKFSAERTEELSDIGESLKIALCCTE
jgi:hypothetical protein